jgi:ribosome-associated toxin RatA of RatAB toxin-antitoxin module
MKKFSVLCLMRFGDKAGQLKGRAVLRSWKSAVVALSALLSAASAVGVSAQFSPVLAKGQMENVSPPFDVVDEMHGQKCFQVVKMVVKAKPEQVFRILVDYENAPSVFPHLKKCHVLEDHGATKIVQHQVQPSGPFGTYNYILEVKEIPNKSLEWHRVKGDFKEVDGYWKLEPSEGGHHTIVTYSSYTNGGLFIPQILIKRQVHVDMPGVMSALKTQAELGTQIAGRPSLGPTRHN